MKEPLIVSGKKSEGEKALKMPKAKAAGGPAQPTQFTSVNIMKQVLTEGGFSPQEADKFINNVAAAIRGNVSKVVQIYKTAFLINLVDAKGKPLPQGTVEMFPFSIEPREAPNRIKVLPNTLKQMGFNKMIAKTDDPDDVEVMKASGLAVNIRQEMVYDGQQMTPMYIVEVSF